MEFNVKLDLMFFVIIGIVVFLIIKLNKYFFLNGPKDRDIK